MLIDARHGLKANDKEALDVLDKAAVSYQIVLTKADKEKPAALEKIVAETRAAIAKRPAAHPEVIATSAATGRRDRPASGGDRRARRCQRSGDPRGLPPVTQVNAPGNTIMRQSLTQALRPDLRWSR